MLLLTEWCVWQNPGRPVVVKNVASLVVVETVVGSVSKGCRGGGPRPCQTKATGWPTTRGAGCGRSRSSSSPRRRCRRRGGSSPQSIMGCRGGGSRPRPSKGLAFRQRRQGLSCGAVPRQSYPQRSGVSDASAAGNIRARRYGQRRGRQGGRASSAPGTMARTRGWPTPRRQIRKVLSGYRGNKPAAHPGGVRQARVECIVQRATDFSRDPANIGLHPIDPVRKYTAKATVQNLNEIISDLSDRDSPISNNPCIDDFCTLHGSLTANKCAKT